MTVKELFQSGKPVVSCEVFPPKNNTIIDSIYRAVEEITRLSPDFISVTYGAGGTGNDKHTADIADFIQKNSASTAVAHLTCVGAEREAIRRRLGELCEMGIGNVLALRGDLPESGETGGDFAHAEDLIHEVCSHGGFCVGAACYPEGHIDCFETEKDLEFMKRKQDAGADYFISQLFFDNEVFYRFRDKASAKGITVPITAGVMPFLGQSQISRMVFMCGASLPSKIVKLLHKYENSPEALRAAGIEYAATQLEDLLAHGVQGVHIYTMNKPDIADFCLRRIGRL